jgi:hypothetical protein
MASRLVTSNHRARSIWARRVSCRIDNADSHLLPDCSSHNKPKPASA